MDKAKLSKSEGKFEIEDENSVDKMPEFTENKTEEKAVEANKEKITPTGPKKAENPSTEAEKAESRNNTEENLVEENIEKSPTEPKEGEHSPIKIQKAESFSIEAEKAESCPTEAESCPTEAENVKSATGEPMEAKSPVTKLKRTESIPTESSEARKAPNSDGFSFIVISKIPGTVAEKNIEETENNFLMMKPTKRKANTSPDNVRRRERKISFSDDKKVINCDY